MENLSNEGTIKILNLENISLKQKIESLQKEKEKLQKVILNILDEIYTLKEK